MSVHHHHTSEPSAPLTKEQQEADNQSVLIFFVVMGVWVMVMTVVFAGLLLSTIPKEDKVERENS